MTSKALIVGQDYSFGRLFSALGYGLAASLEEADFIVLRGGTDISPAIYGQEPGPHTYAHAVERDRLEVAATKAALAAGKGVVGVCRGHQLLHAVTGGTLIQDIGYGHRGPHVATNRLNGEERIKVNSLHHQAVPPEETWHYDEVYTTDDGIVESILDSERRLFGVQWHPEGMSFESDAVQWFGKKLRGLFAIE